MLAYIPVTLFVVCLPIVCLGEPLKEARSADSNQAQFGNEHADFTPGQDGGNFQSWQDWLAKRSFGELQFGDENLQAWKEWMEKRGMLHPGGAPKFGGSYDGTPAFQQWKDWMEKRSFNQNGQANFKGMSPSNKEKFQAWSDWMAKRGFAGFAGGPNGATFGRPVGEKFQGWTDFTKKASFGQLPDFDETGGMQRWNVYKKRFAFGKPAPFSVPFDSKHNLMKWDEMMKKSSDKRQLGSAPAVFGNYRQYFTNGLQDWRNSFKNSKRTASDAKNSKKEDN